MNINSAKLVYFSPTRTTKKIVDAIAQGIQTAAIEHFDLTLPDSTTQNLPEMNGELTIIGSPVYGGRLPIDAVSRFRRLKGNNTPAAVIVAYGNRAYEDALLELRDLAEEQGFKPIAAGAFIGEHSYSTNSTPIAAGRPDAEDLRKAKEFGEKISHKLEMLSEPNDTPPLKVPGNFPYKQLGGLSRISPITNETICIKCGTCATVCPIAAIMVRDAVVTDSNMCIRCCACVKYCSTGARFMEDSRIGQVSEQLSMNCRTRKEPEIYI